MRTMGVCQVSGVDKLAVAQYTPVCVIFFADSPK